MFAVISSPLYWTDIEKVILERNEQILFKSVDTNIDILEETVKLSRLSIQHLIVDITSVLDENKLVQALMQYRIKNEDTQIIIIAPNCIPGNQLIHKLVTQIQIKDIIAPMFNDDISEDVRELLKSSLIEHIENPATYKMSVKWVANDVIANGGNTKEKIVEKEVERTVTIIKDKIVGTVVIAVTGTIKRIGTTHLALSLANFLVSKNFKVGILELHNSPNFLAIKNSYLDVMEHNKYFTLNNIDFYPNNSNINTPDILQQDYNYLILDMGVYSEAVIEEFKRANLRIVISGVKDWELTDLELILRKNDSIYKNKYYFNFSDDDTFKLIKNNMENLECYLSPFNPNPFKNNPEFEKVASELLESYLPAISGSKRSNKLFFKKSK